jgi:hypothetical protein
MAASGAEGFAVDASWIVADANKQRSVPSSEWSKERHPAGASRAMREYLATLDDTAFGAASAVTPKFASPSDPAAQWTGAMRGPTFFAYADNYLVDVKFGVIMDVEASRAIRPAEVGAAKRMIERTEERFGIQPARLAADSAYGSAPTLHWLVDEKQIAPHILVIDKSKRDDGTFSREDFTFDKEHDIYTCPSGKPLTTTRTVVNDDQLLYRASKRDCGVCPWAPRRTGRVHTGCDRPEPAPAGQSRRAAAAGCRYVSGVAQRMLVLHPSRCSRQSKRRHSAYDRISNRGHRSPCRRLLQQNLPEAAATSSVQESVYCGISPVESVKSSNADDARAVLAMLGSM